MLILTVITWLRECLSGPLLQSSSPHPTPLNKWSLRKKVTKWSQHLNRAEYAGPPWAWTLCKLFGISMRERFVCSAPFTLFFNHLFLSVHTCGYLFQTLSYNPIQFYFFYCSNCYSFGHWNIFQKVILLSVSVCACLCTHTTTFNVCVCLYM